MTGFQNLQRQHPQATAIIRAERAAWQAYVDYLESKMPVRDGQVQWKDALAGDDESRRLFRVWRSIRNERDGISNPRHKKQNIRFQQGR